MDPKATLLVSPPNNLCVIDRHGGFTAVMRDGSTLWRPGSVPKHSDHIGTLIAGSVNCNDFYQKNSRVVSALYRIKGYAFPVKVWWHLNGSRLA